MGDVSHPLYGTFARRVRGLVLDGFVLTAVMFIVVFLASTMEFGPTTRLFLFWGLIGLAIMYEPVLVAVRGFTIGQQLCNLRVVAPTPTGRLPFWKAFLRWLLKAITGLGSFATMGATQRNQALHDLPFGTTVQIADPARATSRHFIVERPAMTDGRMPSRWRRLGVIAGYLVAFLLLLTPLMAVGASGACIDRNACEGGERLWVQVVASGWMAASVAVCVFGWKGRLLGARRCPGSAGSAGPVG